MFPNNKLIRVNQKIMTYVILKDREVLLHVKRERVRVEKD